LAYKKKNLWWMFVDREYAWDYACGRQALEDLGYTITSVTADGLSGLPAALAVFCSSSATSTPRRV
jgi:hypothetical protein